MTSEETMQGPREPVKETILRPDNSIQDKPSKLILIIEDNIDSRDLLSKLLRLSGFRVTVAPDAETGYLAAVNHKPDLIITDVNMPRTNGIEFVRRARFDQALSKTPIVVVTAFGSSVARAAREAGANDAVDKPFDFDSFLATVNTLLKPAA
jgi:DNA-binding response OmpR family regulator